MSKTTFRGFDVDELRANKNYGPALIGKEMWEASQAFCSADTGFGALGPALTTDKPTVQVTNLNAIAVPDTVGAPLTPLEEEEEDAEVETEDPWGAYNLVELRDLMKEHEIAVPRALSYGRAIAALEEAGVKPAK